MRDTLDAYADFLADYWHDPMTRRVQALSAARREAITWRRTYQANLPEAYWSYLERYPRGPHVADAGGLLKRLGASIAPPSNFARMDYDVPSPSPDELEYIERSVLVFDDPTFAFEQPQPPPVYFLAPSPPEFLDLTPPTAPSQAHLLPTPSPLPLPAYVHLPADVAERSATPQRRPRNAERQDREWRRDQQRRTGRVLVNYSLTTRLTTRILQAVSVFLPRLRQRRRCSTARDRPPAAKSGHAGTDQGTFGPVFEDCNLNAAGVDGQQGDHK